MLEQRLQQRIESKKTQLDALRPLPPSAVRRLGEQMTVEWIYNSNAIEGNTLSLRETNLILDTGLTIGGKSLREHFEVINHKQAIDYVEALVAGGQPITPFTVRQIHELVLKCVDDEEAGQYRRVPVTITGAPHRPPESWQVPQLMTDWGDWLNGPARHLHPVVRASLAHYRLVAIHPFVDGNGRTARLIMNLLLITDGYPPTVIENVQRHQYYRALARADRGDEAEIVNLVGRAVERSLTRYLEAVTPRSGPPAPEEQWIPLREAAEGTPYSQDYLGLLARNGRLEAIKRGRNWYTTRRAVAEYRTSVSGESGA